MDKVNGSMHFRTNSLVKVSHRCINYTHRSFHSLFYTYLLLSMPSFLYHYLLSIPSFHHFSLPHFVLPILPTCILYLFSQFLLYWFFLYQNFHPIYASPSRFEGRVRSKEQGKKAKWIEKKTGKDNERRIKLHIFLPNVYLFSFIFLFTHASKQFFPHLFVSFL